MRIFPGQAAAVPRYRRIQVRSRRRSGGGRCRSGAAANIIWLPELLLIRHRCNPHVSSAHHTIHQAVAFLQGRRAGGGANRGEREGARGLYRAQLGAGLPSYASTARLTPTSAALTARSCSM